MAFGTDSDFPIEAADNSFDWIRDQPGGASALTLSGIEMEFAGNRVLRGIDLHIPAGQFVAIVGKSGCGKSTLLRILMGLAQQTHGTLQFENARGEAITPNARIVFQEPRLLPWLDVADNVAVGIGNRFHRAEARVHARLALKDVQLLEKVAEWPARLSGGQKQRAALARALVSKPGFLSLDEPMGALDALTRITMQELLAKVWREQGFTAVLVTHDVSEAVTLADRVIVLDEGRISLDLEIPHPHPRKHGDPALARLEGELLSTILDARAA
jgi:sulfonate transport system ATP-binding protein